MGPGALSPLEPRTPRQIMRESDLKDLRDLLASLFHAPSQLMRLWRAAGLGVGTLPQPANASMEEHWASALDVAHKRGAAAMESLVGEALVEYPGNTRLRRLYRQAWRIPGVRIETADVERTFTNIAGLDVLPCHWGPYALRIQLDTTGATSRVYVARPLDFVKGHWILGEVPARLVALKVMKIHLVGEQGARLFQEEMKALSAISHPNIVSIHRGGVNPIQALGYDLPYIEMEFIPGGSLRHRLRPEEARGPLAPFSLSSALSLLEPLASAIVHLHEDHGLVHRDIKPSNILLHEGTPKLADFGLATLIGRGGAASGGTPGWAAPEQWRPGERAGEASDVFSLGALLWAMISGMWPPDQVKGTGRPWLSFEEDVQTAEAFGGLPEGARSFLTETLAPEPSRRIPSARALLAQVRAMKEALLLSAPLSALQREHQQAMALQEAAHAEALGAAEEKIEAEQERRYRQGREAREDRRESQRLKALVEGLRAKVVDLQQSLERESALRREQEAEARKVWGAAQAAERENARLEDHSSLLEGALEDTRRELEAESKLREAWGAKARIAKAAQEEAEVKVQGIRARMETIEDELESTRVALEEASARRAAWEARAHSAHKDALRRQEEAQAVREELKASRRRETQLEQTLSALREECQTLRDSPIWADHQALLAKNQSVERELTETQVQRDEILRARKQLESQVRRLEAASQEADAQRTQERARLEQRRKHVQAQLIRVTVGHTSLLRDLKQVRGEKAEALEQLRRWQGWVTVSWATAAFSLGIALWALLGGPLPGREAEAGSPQPVESGAEGSQAHASRANTAHGEGPPMASTLRPQTSSEERPTPSPTFTPKLERGVVASPPSPDPTPRRREPDRETRATPPPAVSTGELVVSSLPYGLVYIDGEKRGYTPVHVLEATPRKYVIRVTNPDFGACSVVKEVRPGERTLVYLKLDDDAACGRTLP